MCMLTLTDHTRHINSAKSLISGKLGCRCLNFPFARRSQILKLAPCKMLPAILRHYRHTVAFALRKGFLYLCLASRSPPPILPPQTSLYSLYQLAVVLTRFGFARNPRLLRNIALPVSFCVHLASGLLGRRSALCFIGFSLSTHILSTYVFHTLSQLLPFLLSLIVSVQFISTNYSPSAYLEPTCFRFEWQAQHYQPNYLCKVMSSSLHTAI